MGIFLFFANNNYEVIIIKKVITNNRLILFWKIGKFVYEQQNVVEKATDKYSLYFQYRYGMTECFSRKKYSSDAKIVSLFSNIDGAIIIVKLGILFGTFKN